jgi:hypothetical protein
MMLMFFFWPKREDTALHAAARAGKEHVLEWILSNDVDINALNKVGSVSTSSSAHGTNAQLIMAILLHRNARLGAHLSTLLLKMATAP